jgi:carbonic anhydrase
MARAWTTAPCSEDVTWIALKHPITSSAEEIERFFEEDRDNARPILPLYDRVVPESP